MGYYYVQHTLEVVTNAGQIPTQQLWSKDPEIKKKLDQLFAQVSQSVVPSIEKTLANIMPVLQQAMQVMQALAPKPPMDPAQAAVAAAGAETQRKAIDDKQSAALDAAKLQSDSTLRQQANAIAAERVSAMRDIASASDQTRLQQTERDNATAEEIAGMKTAAGQSTGFSTGESLRGGS